MTKDYRTEFHDDGSFTLSHYTDGVKTWTKHLPPLYHQAEKLLSFASSLPWAETEELIMIQNCARGFYISIDETYNRGTAEGKTKPKPWYREPFDTDLISLPFLYSACASLHPLGIKAEASADNKSFTITSHLLDDPELPTTQHKRGRLNEQLGVMVGQIIYDDLANKDTRAMIKYNTYFFIASLKAYHECPSPQLL